MFGLGGWEIGILVVFGLLFFGPKKLPQLMSQVGKVMREVRKASSEFQFSLERELEDDQYKRAHRKARKVAEAIKQKQAAEGGGDASTAAAPPDAGSATPAPPVPPVASNGNGTSHAAEVAEAPAAAADAKPDDRT